MRTRTGYDLKRHLVWVTKYRCQVPAGDVVVRARDLARQAAHDA